MALTKVDDRGLNTPIDLQDDEKIRLGTGNDLEIYHNGSHSIIADFYGQGNIYLISNEVTIKNAGSTEHLARFISNGACELYHDNNKKLETTADGAAVTGRMEDTNGVWIGSNQKYRLYDNGGVSRFDTYAYNIEFVNKGTDGSISPYLARMIPAGAVELYYNGTKTFETAGHGINITGGFIATGNSIINDNAKLQFGNGSDLQLYHDGNNSWITDQGTGSLKIRSVAGSVQILGTGSNDNMAVFTVDGSAALYYDNSKKFETRNTGATVTGTLIADGLTLGSDELINLGSNNNLRLFFEQSSGNNVIQNHYNSLEIRDTSGGGTGVVGAKFVNAAQVELNHNGSKKFETTSDGATITGNIKPDADSTRFLGSNSVRFSKVFADNYEGSAANLTDIFVTGMIMLWSGAANAIPTGWVLCNGSNSTPDLRGKFIVGYSDTDGDYDVGDTGGAASVTLTTNQIPSHSHNLLFGSGSFGGSSGAVVPRDSGTITDRISSTGGGQSHENRPPYYALCYIMKT